MDFPIGDPALDPDSIMRSFEQRVAGIKERAENVKAELEANQVSVTSKDRSVTVTVAGSGQLLGIEAGSRAQGMSPQMLVTKIMETYGQATREAAQRTTQIMSGLIGDNTEAMDVLRSTMPPPPETEEEKPSW